ncbi:MAG: hypothetical protein HY901_22120 [Deltaproteobacteria bacterium]|nr:hypothetical protein [Deltaproteobacteria bacterium]
MSLLTARLRSIACCAIVLLGCDALVEHPRIATPSVRFLAPIDGAPLIEPGPTFAVELEVEGCDQVSTLTVTPRGASRGTAMGPTGIAGRFRGEVPVVDLFDGAPVTSTDPVLVQLVAQVRCDDFGQEAKSDPLALQLSLVSSARPLRSIVRSLEPGPVPGSVLAFADDSLALLTSTGETFGFKSPASAAKAPSAAGRLYFWTPCSDEFCLTRTSLLYVLDPASLVSAPNPPLRLEGELADVVDALELERILTVVANPKPSLRFSRADLSEPTEIALDVVPVGRIGRRQGLEQVFLGFPLQSPGELQIVAVLPGPTVVERPTGFLVQETGDERFAAYTALSPDGEHAVLLAKGGTDLHSFRMADGHHESCPLDASSVWRELEYLTEEHVLLVSSTRAQVLRPSDCAVVWFFEHPTGISAASPAGPGRVALLTGDLQLLVLDPQGGVSSEKPPVPGGALTSNLLVVDDTAFYALESLVVGRRL